MVDFVSSRWEPAIERHRDAGGRAWLTGCMVVAVTALLVFVVHHLLIWDVGDVMLLWCGLAGLGALALWRRAARAARAPAANREAVVLDIDRLRARQAARPHHEARRHRRFVPARRATVLHMNDGRQVSARIVDISIAGVAVEARLGEVDFMSVAKVGSRAAAPVRQTSRGGVFGFATMLDPQPFDATFVL